MRHGAVEVVVVAEADIEGEQHLYRVVIAAVTEVVEVLHLVVVELTNWTIVPRRCP